MTISSQVAMGSHVKMSKLRVFDGGWGTCRVIYNSLNVFLV